MPLPTITKNVRTLNAMRRICHTCSSSWTVFEGEPAVRCRRCNPGDPPTLFERLRDPTDFLGPAWVWCDDRGHGGSWVHRDELFITGKDHYDDLRSLAALLPTNRYGHGEKLLTSVRAELVAQRAELALLRAQMPWEWSVL